MFKYLIRKRLKRLEKYLEEIMATQQELTVQVQAVGATLAKIGQETTALLAKVTELQEQIVLLGNVTPELQAAVDAVASQAGVIDALVPDAPPAPTP